MESNLPSPTIYISSAETDVKFKNELISNLYSQNGNINIQESGFNFDSDITLIERTTSLIKRADLFLLLITPNYLKSRFAQKELELIISANREDGKRIIPIIYEDANIEGSPIANFAFTPQNGSPVINYQDKTEVYTQISNDIWSVVEATYNKKLLSILAETKKSHSTYLDLSKLDLNQIPFDLLEMDWLEELNLSRNQISRISNLDKLNKLNRLDLGFNKIEGISGLDKLDKLKYLNLAHNNISNTSNLESLGQLTILDLFENRIEKLENLGMNINLEFLGLSSNLLTDLSGMSHLFKLKKLYAGHNMIRDLGPLTKMTSLKRIILTNNKIESLEPILPLIEKNGLPVRLKYSFDEDEEGIFIKDNTTLSKPSVEVIESGNDAILKYFKDKEKHGSTKLELLKLILVGNSRVGKTNLSQFFRTGKIDANSNSTHILDIQEWKAPFLKSSEDSVMQLKIFDFGGQDYYHDSHRMYYTHDTAYILVWDANTNKYSAETDSNQPDGENHIYENFPLEYWLESINYNLEGKAMDYYRKNTNTSTSAKSPKVPIFILQNKIEKSEAKLNQLELLKKYPNVWGFFSVSLLEKKRTDILINVLDDYLRDLNLSGRELINFEIEIINKFLDEKGPLRIITLDDFWNECKNFIKDPNIEFNRNNAVIMAQILNNTGLVLFDKTDESNGNIYTNINELNENIKGIMDVARKGSDKGMFNLGQIKDMKYKEEILALLTKNNSIIRISEDYFLAPQFLPVNPDNSTEFFLPAFAYCQMRYQYKAYFHKTLLLNLFAKYVKDAKIDPSIEVKRLPFWRNGIIISKGEGSSKELVFVEFVKTSEMGIVNIRTMKPFNNRGLEKEIEKTFDELNNGWTVDKQISVDSIEFFNVKYLECKVVKEKQFVFTQNCKSYTINDFKSLHNFDKLPKKLFISYSSKNADFISRFMTHLEILKTSGLIEPWYDRMIESGTRWDDAIRLEMKRSDVIIFLLSPDFIATEYIMNTEIPLAIEQFENEKAKFFFVQLLPSGWHRTRLKEFQQTDNPGEKVKNIITINKADNDLDWNTVIDELEDKINSSPGLATPDKPNPANLFESTNCNSLA